jgi:hypothetical protein
MKLSVSKIHGDVLRGIFTLYLGYISYKFQLALAQFFDLLAIDCLTKSVLMKKTIVFNLIVILFYYVVVRVIGEL